MAPARAQVPATFPTNGPRDDRAGRVAFTHATIYTDFQTKLEDATLLIENGRVVAVGKGLKVPAGTAERDQKGNFIYPAFIDAFSGYGLPSAPRGGRSRRAGPQPDTDKAGAFGWNQALKPETRSIEQFTASEDAAASLRKLGFGTVLALPQDGIMRGTGALVALNTRRRENQTVLRPEAAAGLSFDKGSSTQNFPESLMGAIALLRQTYLDAAWQERAGTAEQNLSLQAVRAQRGLPQVFQVRDKLSLLRADRVGDEAGIQYLIRSAGDEYQRVAEVKATGAALIVPLNFPEPYNVEDVYDAADLPLEYLQHWELAPTNPGALAKAGVTFALTADGLKDKAQFWPNLRKAVQYGLSEADALKALTATPARLLGAADRVGALRPGLDASFFITTTPVFDEKAVILDSWVQGDRFPVITQPDDYRGTYRLSLQGQPDRTLLVRGMPEAPEAKLALAPGDTVKATIRFSGEAVTITFAPKAVGTTPSATQRLSGFYTGTGFSGQADVASAAAPIRWTATLLAPRPADIAKRDSAKAVPLALGALTYPLGAYGLTEAPPQEAVLIRNATVWTSDAAGKLEGADVLIGPNGKIAAVGKGLKEPKGARVIDGTGRHLTAGIIDEHSHIAIAEGVNEGTQSVTAEVRIGDVVDSEDLTIYRQLAGGKTATQLLHGSANTIGGQSALVKLRWGVTPEALKIANAPGFIKFALGENVKQSNWGDANTSRFPQTRMGVEQVIDEAFTRAHEYEASFAAYDKLSKKQRAATTAPRRDLELDALVEILRGQRFITCHSYVQSEINMLLKAAERNKFKVNTFTHILEGYKVADKMLAHGANASTFSDWWAYKNEVKDAIPYNAAIMHDAGLNVAINSDDHEMARRLNQEAAKTIKYGGLSEEEALKLVTINPAKMLHLDDRMGSIKVGKDADVVLWSAHPLSIYARAERTYVDGRCYYSLEQDQALRLRRDQERTRLMQSLLAAKRKGEPTQPPKTKPQRRIDCEDFSYDYADDVRGSGQ
ncbi:MAG: amidohydrolase family protein [Hymenobacteraceae bacterium]|nr:amidohydrolase family protein [Hymenobacteraceae bacterium]